LLYVFIVVNGALLVLQRREGEPRGFEVPAAIPVAGMVTSGAMLAYADAQALKIAFLLLVAITVLYVAMRPRGLTEEALEALD
jgi:APA family basic amino acid/polyamine antiporter